MWPRSRDGKITIQSGDKAPLFELRDAAGNEYSLAEALRKGPVIAAFFKISCPVCQFTFPFLERLFKIIWRERRHISGNFAGRCAGHARILPGIWRHVPRPAGRRELHSFQFIWTDKCSVRISDWRGWNCESYVDWLRQNQVGGDSLAELAAIAKRPSAALFSAGEIVPSFKPG